MAQITPEQTTKAIHPVLGIMGGLGPAASCYLYQMITDHTPGYGSAAEYIGVVMKEIIRDATVYGTKYVTIVEIMGRNAGWLTAAAALAKAEDCEGVDMICLPEVPFNVDHFVEKVERMQKDKPSIVIAVSEGASWRMSATSASWRTTYTRWTPSVTRR